MCTRVVCFFPLLFYCESVPASAVMVRRLRFQLLLLLLFFGEEKNMDFKFRKGEAFLLGFFSAFCKRPFPFQ